MATLIGVVTLVSGLIAWVGQILAWLAPSVAVRLGVLEPENEFDPTLRIVERYAMGPSDAALAWMLPLSAALMLLDHAAWPYLALIGAGVFLYFSAVTSLSRIYLRRNGLKVGRPSSERAAYVFGGIWSLCSLAMIGLAIAQLSS